MHDFLRKYHIACNAFLVFIAIVWEMLSFLFHFLFLKGNSNGKDNSGQEDIESKYNTNHPIQNEISLDQTKRFCNTENKYQHTCVLKQKSYEDDLSGEETFGKAISRYTKTKMVIEKCGYFAAFVVSLGLIITMIVII